jgi:hypothetical protein
MATPVTPDAWIRALRAEGVTDIVEMPGWRTNNRNHKGAFGPVYATMIHHTAGEGAGLPSLVFNGTGDLPGPLCHDYLDRTGRLYLVGNGRANHAGRVAQNATDAVRNERSVHPAPGPDALDGNALSYGLECENSGAVGRAWPARQYDVAVRVQAARCRVHGWSEDSVWAHKEATTRKPVDPRLDMDAFRADVAERLRHPASWNPGNITTPTAPQEEDVALSDEDKKWIVATIRSEVGRATAAWKNEAIDPRDNFQIWRDAANHAKAAADQTKNLSATGLTVAQLNTLADGVADKLAARLAD